MIDYLLSFIIWASIFANFFVGLLAYFKNRQKAINIAFSLLAFSGAAWAIGLFFYQHPIFLDSVFWLRFVYITVLILLGLFFNFSFIFPQKINRLSLSPRLFYFLSAIPFAYFIIFTKLFLVEVVAVSWGGQQILGPVYPFFGIWSAFFTGWAIINFFKSHKAVRGLEKIQMKYLFLGCFFFGLIPVILDIILPVLFKNSRFIWFSPVSTAFFVGFTGYVIIKHRFLDIRLVVARAVAYSFLLVILAVFYATGLFMVTTFITGRPSTGSNLAASTCLALIIAFSFQPLRRFFEKITNRLFYKDRYDSNELLHTFSLAMVSTINLSALTHRILDILCTKMKITGGSFVILDKDEIFMVEGSLPKESLSPTREELKELGGKKQMLVFEELEEGRIKEILRKEEISVCLPLETEGNLTGFLLLGEKASGDIYFDQDLKILEIVGPQFAVALQSSLQFELISRFNITLQEKIRNATEDLRQANEHLKELDKLKDEFLSIASHELRTPMTAIKGYLYLVLKKGKFEGQTKHDLSRAYESTERLISLVNDMLNVSRIEGGRLELSPVKFNLADLANTVKEELGSKAEEKQIKVAVAEEKKSFVFADPDKIHIVLTNIIGNALKFTPEKGSITVSFSQKDNKVVTLIADSGIGIKKEDLPKLFSKFGRLDSSYGGISAAPGTGLGLYICKKVIDLSEGEIWVESEEGKGSCFGFSLPVPQTKAGIDIKKR